MEYRTLDVSADDIAGGRCAPRDIGRVAFWRTAYLRAKVFDSLASQCQDQGLLFDLLNHDGMVDVYPDEASAALNEEARKLFPLYPRPDFTAGKQWARDNVFTNNVR